MNGSKREAKRGRRNFRGTERNQKEQSREREKRKILENERSKETKKQYTFVILWFFI